MPQSLLIAFATHIEAKDSIELLRAEQIGQNIWSFSKGQIAVTGMGMLSTLFRLSKTYQLKTTSAVWNLGYAADLKGRELGTIIEVSNSCRPALSGQHDQITQQIYRKCYPELSLRSVHSCAKLVTVDAPIHNTRERSKHALYADLIDMEGYAVAALTNFYQIDCRIIKIVSDHARKSGRNSIIAHASSLSQKLAHWLIAELIDFAP